MKELSLGVLIRKLRKNCGMRQNKLAEMAGMSRSYLSEIETNQKDPNLLRLACIASVLEIPLWVIIFLSLQDNDLPESKKSAWKNFDPVIRNLIAKILPEIKNL